MRTNVLMIILLARVLQIYSCEISVRADNNEISATGNKGGILSKDSLCAVKQILDDHGVTSCGISERFSFFINNSSFVRERVVYYATKKADGTNEEFWTKKESVIQEEDEGRHFVPVSMNKMMDSRRHRQTIRSTTPSQRRRNSLFGNRQWGSGSSKMSSINVEFNHRRMGYNENDSRRSLTRRMLTHESSRRVFAHTEEFTEKKFSPVNRQDSHRRQAEFLSRQQRSTSVTRFKSSRRSFERMSSNSRSSFAEDSIRSEEFSKFKRMGMTIINNDLQMSAFPGANVPRESTGKTGIVQRQGSETKNVDVRRFRLEGNRRYLDTRKKSNRKENTIRNAASIDSREIPVSTTRRLENQSSRTRDIRQRHEFQRDNRDARRVDEIVKATMVPSRQFSAGQLGKGATERQRNARADRLIGHRFKRHFENTEHPENFEETIPLKNRPSTEFPDVWSHNQNAVKSKNWFYENFSSCFLEIALGLFAVFTFMGESGTKKRLRFRNGIKPILANFVY